MTPRHNHRTRDIKERGKCPACDDYHERRDARDPSYGVGPFRLFEVTAAVHLPRGARLPGTAAEWFEIVNEVGSELISVNERRYPLASDVVEMRREGGVRPRYG